ncbi:hypothetical protein CDAR_427101, partial [Caerostris darwini]
MMDWFFCAGPCLGRIKANPASCIFACPATRSADKRSAKLRITEDFECTLQCSVLVMVGMRMCLAGFGIDGCALEWDKTPQKKKQPPQSVLSSKEFFPETSFFLIPTQRWEGDLLGNFQREFKGNDRFKFLKRERTVPACFTPRESHQHRPICKSPRGIHPVSQRHKFRGRMTVVRAFLSPSTVNRDVDSSFIRCINITLQAANCTSASFYLISLFASASVFFLGQNYPRIDLHQSNHRPSLTDAHLTKESGRSRGCISFAVSMHLSTSVVEE